MPLEYILLETDGPYVKPDCPNFTKKARQKARNTSLVIPLAAQRITELKGVTLKEVTEKTAENAVKLFRMNIR